MKGVNKTTIEWVKNPDGSQGYTLSPITGCQNACRNYCYARKLALTRLKNSYLHGNNIVAPIPQITRAAAEADPFHPRFWKERVETLHQLAGVKKRMGVFLCDMGEIAGPWVPVDWLMDIFDGIETARQHRFYILSKCYNSHVVLNYPRNVWVGFSVTTQAQYKMVMELCRLYQDDYSDRIRFLSVEPFLEDIDMDADELKAAGIKWVIAGALSGTKKTLETIMVKTDKDSHTALRLRHWHGTKMVLVPKIEWLAKVGAATKKAGIPLFCKPELEAMPLKDIINLRVMKLLDIDPEKNLCFPQVMPGEKINV